MTNRELDIEIHRRVMDLDCKLFRPGSGEIGSDLDGWYDTPLKVGEIPQSVPCYSTDIAAAWLVVERLTAGKGCWATVCRTDGYDSLALYTCEFGSGVKWWLACGKSPAEAICLTALKMQEEYPLLGELVK